MTTSQRRAPNRTATRKPTDPLLDAHVSLRRAGINATTFPLAQSIRSYVNTRDAADAAITAAVARARYEGMSWSEIADALGVTTQGAHKRYAGITER